MRFSIGSKRPRRLKHARSVLSSSSACWRSTRSSTPKCSRSAADARCWFVAFDQLDLACARNKLSRNTIKGQRSSPRYTSHRRRTVNYNPEIMQTVYEAAGGSDGMLRLASAWHTRVLEDEVVSHAFSHGFHPQHTERLAAYWAEALGGPTTYSDRYGD